MGLLAILKRLLRLFVRLSRFFKKNLKAFLDECFWGIIAVVFRSIAVVFRRYQFNFWLLLFFLIGLFKNLFYLGRDLLYFRLVLIVLFGKYTYLLVECTLNFVFLGELCP